MRIAHILFAEKIAGAERYILELLPALKNLGHEMYLVCICVPEKRDVFQKYCCDLNEKGIETLLLSGRKKNMLSLGFKIKGFLNVKNISIVHSHLINSDILAVFIKLIFKHSLFIISSKHGYDEKFLVKYSGNQATPIQYNLYYYVTKCLLFFIDENLAVSKAIADLYFHINLTKKPYHFIHHGVNPIINKSVKMGNYRFSQQQLIIVGRLEQMKGHKYLIDTLPTIISQYPDLKLLIVGEGTEREKLGRQVQALNVENNVCFLGFQPDPFKYIINSDIIILPSLFEPFGLVYIEAFALHVPVIAFNVGATNEIIEDNETGVLVKKYDSVAIADKILFWLKNPSERIRISNNAFNSFNKNFTVKKMAEKTSNWYSSLQMNK